MADADIPPPNVSGNSDSRKAYVYAISAGADVTKIGKATNPANRLKELQTSHHLTLVLLYSLECMAEEAAAVEREAHYLLRRYRLEGEWFRVSGEDAQRTICQALDVVRIRENLGEAGKTPRTDAAERFVSRIPEHAREDCAWKTARQFECELRELQRKLKEQAA
jgi:hypothetical protein